MRLPAFVCLSVSKITHKRVCNQGRKGRGTIPGRETRVGELTNVHTKQGLPSWLGED